MKLYVQAGLTQKQTKCTLRTPSCKAAPSKTGWKLSNYSPTFYKSTNLSSEAPKSALLLRIRFAYQILVTFILTNVLAERSFSQLKRIKNPYRTTMGQRDLTLYPLCIEANMLRSVDFNDVSKDFALAKSRKRTFWIMYCIASPLQNTQWLVSV